MKRPYSKADIRELLENDAIDGDGHSILDAKFFANRGIEDLPEGLIQRHESGEGKYQITTEGKPVTHVDGVWTLDFHRWIAHECGVSYMTSFGRGSQARFIADALREWAHSDEES